MIDNRIISIAIPTYNRVEMPLEAIRKIHDDGRVEEIVLSDDASDMGVYEELKRRCAEYPKVKLYENVTNRDCYANKAVAVAHTSNRWCVLLDSDNIIDSSYLDKLSEIEHWDSRTIYAPDFAMPSFNYHAFSGLEITRENVAEYMDMPMFEVCLNTCNFFVNSNAYVDVWDGTTDPVTSDSIYFNMRWLEAGNKIKIVEGMWYQHRIHDHSHYNNNKHRTAPGFHESVLNRLKQLR